MKRAVFLSVIAGIAVLVWTVSQFVNIRLRATTSTASPLPTITTAIIKTNTSIVVNDDSYEYAYVTVATPSGISLIPNFAARRDAKSLAATNGCTSVINGGFYDTAGKPLGYFFTDTRTYGQQIQNALVNGYFWADSGGDAVISTELQRSISYRFALQTGPLLLFNGQTMTLTIHSDKPARRMVIAKTTDNQFIFLTVYSADSVFNGPLLADLPSAVSQISKQNSLGIADALNLDGGSASAFYSGTTGLAELTPVGSLLCIH